MKPLIAVTSCHAHASRRAACRRAWFKSPALFFVGQPITSGLSDEVFLDCPDDYPRLPLKVRAICQYALDHNYTHMFKADDDTYVNIPRLLSSGFEQHDYTGRCCGNFAHGGAGYWLSRRSMEALIATPLWVWEASRAEDMMVGRSLQNAGINMTKDDRYAVGIGFPFPGNNLITFHPWST